LFWLWLGGSSLRFRQTLQSWGSSSDPHAELQIGDKVIEVGKSIPQESEDTQHLQVLSSRMPTRLIAPLQGLAELVVLSPNWPGIVIR